MDSASRIKDIFYSYILELEMLDSHSSAFHIYGINDEMGTHRTSDRAFIKVAWILRF
jgi:hypothetical protein